MVLNIFTKLLNLIYSRYLKFYYRSFTIDLNARVDYRCEILYKSNITLNRDCILYKCVTIYKHKEGCFTLGASSHIAPYGYLLIEKQNLHIGDNVAIGPFCSIFCSSNDIPADKDILFKDSYKKADVNIGSNVFIGAQCVILPGTRIGDNVVVAAHSTVKGELEEGYLYAGNPAVKIKKVYT